MGVWSQANLKKSQGTIYSNVSLTKCSRLHLFSLDIAEDLCRRRKPEEAMPYILEAMKDKNNLDVMIQASFLMSRSEGIETLEEAERRGTWPNPSLSSKRFTIFP